jgi:hypothetical protein
MTFSYFPNVPNAPDDPADDQPQMQINTASISSLISVDHIGFNTANGGYHNIIHFPNQGSDPAPIALIGQLYTKQVTFNSITDNALFFESGGGRITQLTTPGTASGTANGYTFLPGGIILQWGVVSMAFSSGSTTGTVTFSSSNIAFPNNCFVVTGNPLVTFSSLPSSQASLNIRQSTISNLKFDWQFYTNSAQYIGFFWSAIGN